MSKRKAALVAASLVVLSAAGMAAARQERGAPGVSLAQSVVAAASAFEHYTHEAGAISAGFRGGEDVARALRQGAAYKHDQFEEGMIAYGAIAALQERDFVEGVRDAAREGGPEALAQRLTARPDLVLQIEGVGSAVARAQAALLRQSGPLGSAGRAVKQSAYDIQHQSWSKDTIVDSAGRLARVKAISATAFTPDDRDASRLIQSATAPQGGEGNGAATAVTVRAAALAALAVLGAAGDEDAGRLTSVLHDPKADSCMKMAKLNLYQCLAVAGPHYEDVFCLGQHAMMETAQCVSDAAGASKAMISPATPARSRGFSVPIASN